MDSKVIGLNKRETKTNIQVKTDRTEQGNPYESTMPDKKNTISELVETSRILFLEQISTCRFRLHHTSGYIYDYFTWLKSIIFQHSKMK